MSSIYIFDLDGTLADCSHRLHWIQGENKDWECFYEDCDEDQPIQWVIDILKQIARNLYNQIIILTGRSDAVMEQTEAWLFNQDISYDQLIMRKSRDWRPDHVIKKEWLDKFHSKNRIACAFEDRTQVVEMWRDSGVPCLQVAKGDF